jgi:peroxiredoxin family protein
MPAYLPEMKKALEAKNVEIRGCSETLKIIDVKKPPKKTGVPNISI